MVVCVCTVQRMHCPTDRAADQRERHLLPRIRHSSQATVPKLAQLSYPLARDRKLDEKYRCQNRRTWGGSVTPAVLLPPIMDPYASQPRGRNRAQTRGIRRRCPFPPKLSQAVPYLESLGSVVPRI